MATRKRKTSSTSGQASERGGVWLVLHLRPKKRGSMEQQLLALAERLGRRSTPLTMVFPERPKPWLEHELAERRVSVRTLSFAKPYVAAMELLSQLRAARPELVHFHFVRASSPLVVAAKLAGAKVIVNDHVTLTRASRSRTREALKQARDLVYNPVVDVRIAVSRVVADSVADVEHVDRQRLVVVENGIDVDRFERAEKKGVKTELDARGKPLLVCVSRLAAEKGVETAIRALPLIGRDAVLALVGDGPIAARCEALAAELGVADRVRFLGVRDDVERLLAACDVAIVPSHWEEAFGLAVVEAMAAGKPVVVSQSGAMPEIVADAGLVVPKKDPVALAGAVTRVLDDPLLAQRLGRAARRRARARYDMDRYLDETIAVYQRLCPSLQAVKAA